MLWIGIGIGVLIGSPIGFLTCALMVIAKQADWFSNEFNQNQEES